MKKLNLKAKGFYLENIKVKICRYFLKKEGGKTRLRLNRIGTTASSLIFVFIAIILLFENQDTSFMEHSSQKIIESTKETKSLKNSDRIKQWSYDGHKNKKIKNLSINNERRLSKEIKYKAKQILEPNDNQNLYDSLPTGSNMIGKLLTAIDTRDENQIIKVILPFGGVFKNNRILENNTIVLGRASYPEEGKKVFVSFYKGINPNGKEFKIEAQALNSKNYSSGLEGEYHSQADLRLLANLGLKVISASSEVLVEKEGLSDSHAPTPRANIKNAFLRGLSEGANIEASRQAQKVRAKKEYVTIDAGEDIIVSLISRLSKDQAN